jgi:hypothetical protein
MDLAHDKGGLLFFECHESNYGLLNILKGARAEELQNGRVAGSKD